MKRLAVTAAALLLVAACKPKDQPAVDSAAMAPAMNPAPAATPAATDTMMMHDSAMMKMGKDSAMKHDTSMTKKRAKKP